MSATVKQQQISIPFKLDVRPLKMSDRAFYDFCQRNQDFRFEINAKGELIIMPPTTLETSRKNSEINFHDAFWILKERYYALSVEDREERFAPICPDFVVELRSKSDRLKTLQNKMREYIENGARLGWLIDPYEKKVHVYRADKTVEIPDNPKRVSGENVLQAFELDLTEIW